MRSRQPFAPLPLPRLWLMTDERMGDRLLPSVAALPSGSGIIFRHYRTAPPERRALFRAVQRTAQLQGLSLLLADSPERARQWHADGVHLRGGDRTVIAAARRAQRCGLIVTQSAHDAEQLLRANRSGAAAILSPVYATRSHPGAAVLGEQGFAALAHKAQVPIIALGGMTAQRFTRLPQAWGWAGIDALMV